jgi:putative ABC transport system permease protein
VWIAVLGLTNVRARREEIGILRAIGIGTRHILVMFLSRHVLVGALGGAVGFAAGIWSVIYFSATREGAPIGITDMNLSWIGLLVLSVVGAAALAVIAGWIPTMIATRQDPADVLREE